MTSQVSVSMTSIPKRVESRCQVLVDELKGLDS